MKCDDWLVDAMFLQVINGFRRRYVSVMQQAIFTLSFIMKMAQWSIKKGMYIFKMNIQHFEHYNRYKIAIMNGEDDIQHDGVLFGRWNGPRFY